MEVERIRMGSNRAEISDFTNLAYQTSRSSETIGYRAKWAAEQMRGCRKKSISGISGRDEYTSVT